MSGAAVHPCSCQNQYQDEHYGSGKRVMSIMANGQKRCSVCEKIHGSPKTEKK